MITRIVLPMLDLAIIVLGATVVLAIIERVTTPRREFMCRMQWTTVAEYAALVDLCREPSTREAILDAARADRRARAIEAFNDTMGEPL